MQNRRDFLSLAFAASVSASTPLIAQQAGGAQARVVRRQKLDGKFAGMEAVMTELTYAPGASSGPHQHGGMVLGYVVEGEFKFAINGEQATVLKAGDTFYEPPGAHHTVSANGSADKPAKIIVTIIVPEGAAVTSPL